jgi:hypothetical protein
VAKERRGLKTRNDAVKFEALKRRLDFFVGHGRGKKKKWGREESPTIRVHTCMKNTRYAPSNSHNISRFSSISVSSDIILIASSISRKVTFFSFNSAYEFVVFFFLSVLFRVKNRLILSRTREWIKYVSESKLCIDID